MGEYNQEDLSNAKFQGKVLSELNHIKESLDSLVDDVSLNTNFRKEFNIKMGVVATVSTAIGGVIVFVINFVWDWYKTIKLK